MCRFVSFNRSGRQHRRKSVSAAISGVSSTRHGAYIYKILNSTLQ